MNSFQISNILKTNKYTKKYFLGVFASNKIPPITHFPTFLVVNTDKEGRAGIHWQAIVIACPNRIEFFDSFGREPAGPIKRFVDRFDHVSINRKKIQSKLEISCGPHVIYFLIERGKGASFNQIGEKISKMAFSDSFVKFYTAFLSKP